ncbi:SDR family NAD(P)-dependent oxidoreductase [Rhodopila sp.]|uniref:SDR family NAD(P)-dependent oxidoreductase n=1 Tax=Rhodopila sp. TaxID=2480087 RepID=UPI003D0FB4D6
MQQGTIIVTGAGRGLGREIALTLAAAGMAVAATDVDGSAAEATAAAITAKDGRALGLSLDVRDATAIKAAFTAAEKAIGLATALVNNAGIYPDNTLLDMPEATWDAVIDTNLKGTFLCAQRFVRQRIAAGGGGAIVNLASTAAFSARIGAGHNSASKAGVAMLTRSMAQEWGPHGIRVNAVAPGLIEVEGNRVNPEYKANFLPMIPLGRTGQPPDIAATVAFLLSDGAAFINGVVLPVDGGFLTGRPLQRSGGI